jgi:hypothetical protein
MKTPPSSPPVDVLPLRRGWPRQKHVLKHLYRRNQRWDFIVKELPPALRERALQAGCEPIDRVQGGSKQWERLCKSCEDLVQADHDAYYKPAYMDSLRTALELGRARALPSSVGRYAYVGTNGVLVIATGGSDGLPPRVVSAYRRSLGDGEQRRPEEFVDAAVRRWRDKTSLMTPSALQDEEDE